MIRSAYTIVKYRPLPTSCTGNLRYKGNYDQDEQRTSSTMRRIKKELEEDKKKLAWRQPIGDRPGEWNSKFKLFGNEEQTSDFIIMMQQPIDFSLKGLREAWHKREERRERFMQQYIPERHEILGAELAAAHFLLYRGGAVKFVNDQQWIRADKDDNFNLPNKFHPAYKVEALRCDNMRIYYEGLENLRCLQHLKFLSFHNVATFDDFCLDRVSGSQYHKLEVLDISGTQCTANGLTCLYRIPTLKLLILDDPKKSLKYELTCTMLQEVIHNLNIKAADVVHNL